MRVATLSKTVIFSSYFRLLYKRRLESLLLRKARASLRRWARLCKREPGSLEAAVLNWSTVMTKSRKLTDIS